MRSAGVDARCDRQDEDGEILLTIRIPPGHSVKMFHVKPFSFPISPFLPIACRSQIAWRQARSRLSPSVCTSPLAAAAPVRSAAFSRYQAGKTGKRVEMRSLG